MLELESNFLCVQKIKYPLNVLLDLQHNLKKLIKFFINFINFIKSDISLFFLHRRPAAKIVPLADPKVEIATDKGINQAITPSIRVPKV